MCRGSINHEYCSLVYKLTSDADLQYALSVPVRTFRHGIQYLKVDILGIDKHLPRVHGLNGDVVLDRLGHGKVPLHGHSHRRVSRAGQRNVLERTKYFIALLLML
jgi:hypothetical protein